MTETTTIRVDRGTRDDLRELAHASGLTLAETVARGVVLLRQERMGRELARPLDPSEEQWLDADAG